MVVIQGISGHLGTFSRFRGLGLDRVLSICEGGGLAPPAAPSPLLTWQPSNHIRIRALFFGLNIF